MQTEDEQDDDDQDIQISGMVNASQLNKSLHTLDESYLQPLLADSLGDSSNDPLNSFVIGIDGDSNEVNIDLGLEADLGWDLNFRQESSVRSLVYPTSADPFFSHDMNIDPEQPAVIRLVGEDAEVENCPFVDNTDIRDALQVGRDVDKRLRAGQKRVRNWFQITSLGCTDCSVGAGG